MATKRRDRHWWWTRVLVPALGTGGLATILVALINRDDGSAAKPKHSTYSARDVAGPYVVGDHATIQIATTPAPFSPPQKASKFPTVPNTHGEIQVDSTEQQIISLLTDVPKGATISIVVSGPGADSAKTEITKVITVQKRLQILVIDTEVEVQGEIEQMAEAFILRVMPRLIKPQYLFFYDIDAQEARVFEIESSQLVATGTVNL